MIFAGGDHQPGAFQPAGILCAQVVAFGPGLITRTGFFRSQPPLFVKVFDFADIPWLLGCVL